MSYPQQRNKRQALLTGATDGKYVSQRINTEVGPDNAAGNHKTIADKQTLDPLNGYADLESPLKVVPNA